MPILFQARPTTTLLALLSAACGGSAFSAGTQAGGGGADVSSTASTAQGTGGATGEGGASSTGGAGTTGMGGAAGDVGGSSAGGSGAGGSSAGGSGGGAAGSPIDASVDVVAMRDGGDASTTCAPACAPGQYCNSSTRVCAPCSDLSRLQFGAPTKLAAPSSGPAQGQNFPREAARANFRGLLYSFDSQASTGTDIAFAPGASPTWPAGTALPAPIAATGVDEAPLPMNAALDFAFLYDSEEGGVRSIYAAGMGAGWTRTLFGDPATALNSSGNNYHVAAQIVGAAGMSSSIGRLWWTTDRQGATGMGGVRMVTANPSDTLAVDVPIVQANNCHTGGDLEPWVVSGGNVLFFSSLIYVGTTCSDNGDAKRRLSYTQVDPTTGQQLGRATAVGWHTTGYDDHAPSLTVDMCALLFASNRDGGTDLDLYLSPRN